VHLHLISLRTSRSLCWHWRKWFSTRTQLHRRSYNQLRLLQTSQSLHIYELCSQILLATVGAMITANNGRQEIPLRPLFRPSTADTPSPVDKPRRATLAPQHQARRKSVTYKGHIEKHHANSRKRRGRASPELDQQFAGKLDNLAIFSQPLTRFQMASRIPAKRSEKQQTRCCQRWKAMPI
jgi:hypothetical protein